ncbi:MAG: hypothetical protein HY581_02380 [Nitrospirae bacterium]|nr:hypothetical protein [Nitrospirota bacterium]
MMARFIGKGLLSIGFVLVIYGLTDESPVMMRSGLGLVEAGILAAGYSLYRAFAARWQQPDR